MQKRTKRLIVAFSVILSVIIIFVVGFFCVKNAFSPPDSFYESDVTTEKRENSAEAENSEQEPAGEETVTSGENAADDESEKRRELPQEVLNLTTVEIKALQKKVSFKDKLAVLSILSTSLSAKEYTGLFGMLSGGITREEIKEAYNVVNRKLSPENREKFWGYYDKYKHLIP